MKKSQSILLLSGFVPLVATPIVIVASCSNDTTTPTTPTDTKYRIVLKRDNFGYGDRTKPSNHVTIDDEWVKDTVIKLKNDIFTAYSGTLPTDYWFWYNNLTVQIFNRENQTLRFTLKLTNASTVDGATAEERTINALITFTGFRDDKAPLASE